MEVEASLGRYTIIKQLAAGERVDVLLAGADGQYVVLSQLRPEYARDPQLVERFLAEARLAAQLEHPNIARICDVSAVDGECFVAREYVHGESLQDMLAEIRAAWVRLPLGHAIAIASAASAGAQHAHEILDQEPRPPGAVVRDIEPSKILVGYDGSIRLADLGMSRSWTLGERSPGELSYVAPEKRDGGVSDARSDVYALGAVLYELVTLNRLFKDDAAPSAMEQLLAGQATVPLALRAHAPDALWAIIIRALSPDPERRFQTAGELRAALDVFARGAASQETPATLAAYLRKQLGERPEPWRELDPAEVSVTPIRPSMHDLGRSGGSVVQPRSAEPDPRESSALGRPSSMVMPRISQDIGFVPLPSTFAPAPIPPRVDPAVVPAARPRSPAALAIGIGAPLILAAAVAVWWLSTPRGAARSTAAPAIADSGGLSPITRDPVDDTPGLPRVVAVGKDPSAAAPGPATPRAAAEPPVEHERAAAGVHRPHEAPPRRIAKYEPVIRPRKPADASPEPPSAAPQAGSVVTAPAAPAPGAPAAGPPQHVAVSTQEPAEPAPAPASPPVPSGPPPTPAAPAASADASASSAPRVVTAAALEASRLAGDSDIVPDEATRAEIRRSGASTIAGAYKICVAADGKIVSVGVLKSTGYPAYDSKIQSVILGTWRYRPVVVDGKPGPVCSGAKVTLWSSTTKWGNRPTWH